VIDIFVQSQISSAESRVPSSESRNSELGTWGSGFGTWGSGFGTWHLGQKFDLHIFDRYLCPVSNIKSRVPSSGFRDSVHGTRGLALGTWGQKFDCHIFVSLSGHRCQVLSSEFHVSGLDTRHSEFRVWHGEISHLYL
jgi:hypothetical protein